MGRYSNPGKRRKSKDTGHIWRKSYYWHFEGSGKEQSHSCYLQAVPPHTHWDKERHNISLSEKPSNTELCIEGGEGEGGKHSNKSESGVRKTGARRHGNTRNW